jgi:hypothetical protein
MTRPLTILVYFVLGALLCGCAAPVRQVQQPAVKHHMGGVDTNRPPALPQHEAAAAPAHEMAGYQFRDSQGCLVVVITNGLAVADWVTNAPDCLHGWTRTIRFNFPADATNYLWNLQTCYGIGQAWITVASNCYYGPWLSTNLPTVTNTQPVQLWRVERGAHVNG